MNLNECDSQFPDLFLYGEKDDKRKKMDKYLLKGEIINFREWISEEGWGIDKELFPWVGIWGF